MLEHRLEIFLRYVWLYFTKGKSRANFFARRARTALEKSEALRRRNSVYIYTCIYEYEDPANDP